MRSTLCVAGDLLREALHRRFLLALLLAITLVAGVLGWTLQLEVIDGVLAGTRLFGSALSHDLTATDLAMRPVYSAAALFLYVLGSLFGVLVCSDFAPELFAVGRIEQLLALPLRRSQLVVGTYLGVMALALACALYAGLLFTLLFGWKSGVWSWCILAGGLAGCLAFSALYAAMLLCAVFVRSAALSAVVGVVLLVVGLGVARPDFAAVFEVGTVRNLFIAAVSFVPRFWLLGRLGPVAGGFEPLSTEIVRAAAATLIFAGSCVMLAIWRVERRDY